uniref:Uncharacterized protein n=1 Tax=Cacopsylla melanoneura TaxID=428564 RepID=A0A8D8U8I0_9HEMI
MKVLGFPWLQMCWKTLFMWMIFSVQYQTLSLLVSCATNLFRFWPRENLHSANGLRRILKYWVIYQSRISKNLILVFGVKMNRLKYWDYSGALVVIHSRIQSQLIITIM